MNELFSEQKFIDIELFYKIEKTKNGQTIPIVITEDEYTKMRASDQKDRAKSLKTTWRQPSWKQANDLLEASTVYNFQKQENDINWNRFRDRRLKSLLVGWDIKNEKGEAAPCNEEMINALHQNIALALLAAYDDATQISKEANEKN